MTVDLAVAPFNSQQIAAFARDGYAVVPGLFTAAELEELIATSNELHAQGEIPGCFHALSPAETSDPLLLYPRMMQPHRVNRTALRYLLSPRWEPHLRSLFGEAPIAAQSMYYWKPPGARGQALHQDNFYLKAYPGTCLAAWLAVDPADRENGGLFVVPGSHAMDLFCPEAADPTISFTKELVPVPEGLQPVPVDLDAGDVLFFGGNLIHGSEPNRSPDRFRRSFICHYVGASSEEIARSYKPLYRFDATRFDIATATGGGPCGTPHN